MTSDDVAIVPFSGRGYSLVDAQQPAQQPALMLRLQNLKDVASAWRLQLSPMHQRDLLDKVDDYLLQIVMLATSQNAASEDNVVIMEKQYEEMSHWMVGATRGSSIKEDESNKTVYYVEDEESQDTTPMGQPDPTDDSQMHVEESH